MRDTHGMPEMPQGWQSIVFAALAEDLGVSGDVTTQAVVSPDAEARAAIVFRQSGLVCGLGVAEAVFYAVGKGLDVAWSAADGDRVASGGAVGHIQGPAAPILAGERTALNLVSRLSGIATRTAEFVAAVAGTGVEIYDTRKTVPGLRVLDKYAVAVGGGCNHRMGLYDQVLIKDNHLAVVGGVMQAVRAARARWGDRFPIEVEVGTEADAVAAAEAGADIIMLDNMSTAEMRRAVRAVGERAVLEASGGITLRTVKAVAETGVHRISVGVLTDGPGLDVALDIG